MQLAKRHLLLLHTLTIIMLNDKLFYIVAINWYREKYMKELRMPVIKGAFRVKKTSILNGWNNVHYLLLFLEDRLVFARIGGAWAYLTAPKPTVIQEQLKKFRLMRVEEILKLSKRNFQISYNDIVRIKLINETMRGLKTGTISIMTLKNATFEIPPYQYFETCFNPFYACAIKVLYWPTFFE